MSTKRYRYTGMERDDETGLALHGLRFYAPWLGRWMSCDPIGLSGGANRYTYSSLTPVGHRDPEGTDDEESAWALGAEAGALWYLAGAPDDLKQILSSTGGGPIQGEIVGLVFHLSGVDELATQAGEDSSRKFNEAWEADPLAATAAFGGAVVGIFVVESIADPSPAGEAGAGFRLTRVSGEAVQDAVLGWVRRQGLTFDNLVMMAQDGRNWLEDLVSGALSEGRKAWNSLAGRFRGRLPGPDPSKAPLPKVRGTQVGLGKPAQVDEIKTAMRDGTYEFTADRGRVAGYLDESGTYHVTEGHHRMAAAQELFRETGDPTYVQRLLDEGLFEQRATAPPGSRPLPGRDWWSAFRNAVGF